MARRRARHPLLRPVSPRRSTAAAGPSPALLLLAPFVTSTVIESCSAQVSPASSIWRNRRARVSFASRCFSHAPRLSPFGYWSDRLAFPAALSTLITILVDSSLSVWRAIAQKGPLASRSSNRHALSLRGSDAQRPSEQRNLKIIDSPFTTNSAPCSPQGWRDVSTRPPIRDSISKMVTRACLACMPRVNAAASPARPAPTIAASGTSGGSLTLILADVSR